MRALLRATACIAVLTPFALLAAGSAGAVTITSAQIQDSFSGTGTTSLNVATAADDPYCSGTIFVITGTGFVSDGGPVKVSIGNVPANWVQIGSDHTIYAQVGKGATTGPIIVTTAAGSFSSDQLPGGRIGNTAGTGTDALKPGIQIYPCVSQPTIGKPAIASIKPLKVKGGKKLAITGSGFAYTTSVTVGGKAAVYAIVQDQNMVVLVPKTAKNGKLKLVITNGSGSATSTITKTG